MSRFQALRLLAKTSETPEAATLRFEKPADWTYQPGQYLTLKVPGPEGELRRAYSLSSAPGLDADLAVTVKAIEGGRASSFLVHQLQPGQSLEVLPPMGKFFLRPDASNRIHYVLVGAGSGITPLFSMLRTLLAQEAGSRITLLYGNRTQDSIIFAPQLEELVHEYPDRLKVIHVLSRPEVGWTGAKGRIEGRQAYDLLLDIKQCDGMDKRYCLCGPDAMMAAVMDVLDMLGVPERHILREYYSAPIDEDGDGDEAEYQIVDRTISCTIDGDTRQVMVPAGKYILDAAIDAGMDPPYACQEGICCTCRGKLESGQVSMSTREGISDEELEAGYILTCVSQPLTDDVVVVYG